MNARRVCRIVCPTAIMDIGFSISLISSRFISMPTRNSRNPRPSSDISVSVCVSPTMFSSAGPSTSPVIR